MAKKQRKIIMNGNLWGKYNLEFITYLKLLLIRTYLWALRWFRRIKRGIGYCKYVLILVPFWAFYVAVVYYLGIQREQPYPIMEILWDMKLSVFTSVILASITTFITKYEKNKYSYLEQHRIYINIMGDCSQLYKDLLDMLYLDTSKNYVPFWPFYTANLHKSLNQQFKNVRSIDKSSISYRNVITSISKLHRSIEELARSQYNGILAEVNNVKINSLITNSLDKLSQLERQLDSDINYEHWDILLSCMSDDLYDLIDLLRTPWRRDLKWKLISLKLIYIEDKSVAGTFYNSALLDVIDYDFYETLSKYQNAKNKNQKKRKKLRNRYSKRNNYYVRTINNNNL